MEDESGWERRGGGSEKVRCKEGHCFELQGRLGVEALLGVNWRL